MAKKSVVAQKFVFCIAIAVILSLSLVAFAQAADDSGTGFSLWNWIKGLFGKENKITGNQILNPVCCCESSYGWKSCDDSITSGAACKGMCSNLAEPGEKVNGTIVDGCGQCQAAVVCYDNDLDGYNMSGDVSCGVVDCDDYNAAIHPGASEVPCNGIDENCDYTDFIGTDADGDGFKIEGGACGTADCNDSDVDIYPGAFELCDDGLDNDCNGMIDAADPVCISPPGLYFCGQTVTGNVLLNADLNCIGADAGKSGLIVGAAGITIDCAGHRILGSRTLSYSGINGATKYGGVTVKNCIIENFSTAIYVFKGAGWTIRNNTLRYNNPPSGSGGMGVSFKDCANCNALVENNNLSNNYYGVYMTNSSKITVNSNFFYNDTVAVSTFQLVNNLTVTDNTFIGNWRAVRISNDETHWYWKNSRGNSIIGNRIYDSQADGILLYQVYETAVKDNIVTNSKVAGLNLNGMTKDSIVSGNTFTGNNMSVFLNYYDSTNNSFSSNYFKGSTSYGVFVFRNSGMTNNTNNRFYNNFFNNTNNARDDSFNWWNTTKTAGTNIIGGSNIGGNYYATPAGNGFSQTCTSGADGICTTSYTIPGTAGSKDNLPLSTAVVVCVDGDGDGYNATGGSCGAVDCNDANNAIHPGAAETCNNVDDDCDGTKDESLTRGTTCGVGACAGNTGSETCTAGVWGGNTCNPLAGAGTETCNSIDDDCDASVDEGIIAAPTSCGIGACAATGQLSCVGGSMVDNCAPVAPGTDNDCDGIDDDCDGTADEHYVATGTSCGIGVCAATGQMICVAGAVQNTCSAGSPTGTDNNCNGLDENCNGASDENYVAASTNCGVGACASIGQLICSGGTTSDTCTAGSPTGTDNDCDNIDDDCDGSKDESYVPITSCFLPGVCSSGNAASTCAAGVETACHAGSPTGTDDNCNGLDENCNGASDENYVPTSTSCGVGACHATGQLICSGGTTSDTCVAGIPTTETCNNIDDDCDNNVDESLTRGTTCGVGACSGNAGIETCGAGIWGGDTCNPFAGATTEICDSGIDNDCDGTADDADSSVVGQPIWYADSDSDTFGNAAVSQAKCVQPSGYVSNNADCDDVLPGVHPGAADVCNGINDDCNALTLDGSGEAAPLNNNQFGVCALSNKTCTSGAWHENYVGISKYEASEISCDGFDNDCDASVDEVDMDSDGSVVCGGIDCNDANLNIFPANPNAFCDCNAGDGYAQGQSETTYFRCNDLWDNDCDGLINAADPNCGGLVSAPNIDGDGFDSVGPETPSDSDGKVADCNDANANIFPLNVNNFCDCDSGDGSAQGVTEVCDAKDNDCDGVVDETCATAQADLYNPTSDMSILEGSVFNFDVNVSCHGGDCPSIKVYLDPVAWWDNAWAYRNKITINEYKVAADLTNFPMLVRLDATNFQFNLANADGSDLRFTDASGSLLDYEIERFDAGLKKAEVWVLVPAISGSVNTEIYMYYNNPSATSNVQNPGAVWSNYAAVWHLGENVTDEAATATHYDSSSNHNNGAQNKNSRTTGMIGYAQYFDGTDDNIKVLKSASLAVPYAKSVSFWARTSAKTRAFITKGQSRAGVTSREFDLYGDNVNLAMVSASYAKSNSTATLRAIASGFPSAGVWHYYAMTWDGTLTGNSSIYVDGALFVTKPVNYADGSMSNTLDWYIGGSSSYQTLGEIDEMRIAGAGRSAAWIDSSYQNQKDPSGFYSVSAKESFSKSGLVSTVSGAVPFYTSQNPKIISLMNGQSQIVSFTVNTNGLPYSTHKFYAFANLSTNPISYSETGIVNIQIVSEIPKSSTFQTDYGTTDFAAESDLHNVLGLTLANVFGKIEFPASHAVDALGENYDDNIDIGDGYIMVNTAALNPTFNSSATITMNNIDCAGFVTVYYRPEGFALASDILTGGSDCVNDGVCTNAQCVDTTLTFDVSHFTSFAPLVCHDGDDDGYSSIGGLCGEVDCDDGNAAANPGMIEDCDNGFDDDCSGAADIEDPSCLVNVCTDADGDGYDAYDAVSCTTGDDCDDGNSLVNPGAAESCDGIDNNCDGKIDFVSASGDLDASCGASGCDGTDIFFNRYCNEGVGCVAEQGVQDNDNDGFNGMCTDCNDNNAAIHPGVQETCPDDGVDSNCDGEVTFDCNAWCDKDNDNYFDSSKWWCFGSDCNDNNANVNPGAAEVCDSEDNNCDGAVDNRDADNDNFNDCSGADKCLGTTVGLGNVVPTVSLKPNAAGDDKVFLGCDCEQILKCKPGEDTGEYKNGCSPGTVNVWSSQVGWSLDCQEIGPLGFLVVKSGEAQTDADNDLDGIPDSEDDDDDNDGVLDVNDLQPKDKANSGSPDWWCRKYKGKCTA